MWHLLRMEEMSTSTMSLIIAGVALCGLLIGAITDSVMGDRGFGAIGNGLLTLMGCVLGLYAEQALLGPAYVRDALMTGLFAAAGATAILMTFGLIKHWVQD